MTGFYNLPDELIVYVFSLLNLLSFLSMRCVSKRFLKASKTDENLKMFLPLMFLWLKVECMPKDNILQFYHSIVNLRNKINNMTNCNIPDFSRSYFKRLKSNFYTSYDDGVALFINKKPPFKMIRERRLFTLKHSMEIFTHKDSPGVIFIFIDGIPGFRRIGISELTDLIKQGHYVEVKRDCKIEEYDYEFGRKIRLIIDDSFPVTIKY